ncbi:hypothetical protein [Nocardiopsis composta]|uniref:Lipoprotein n=1 Tax=Nocardiopsis composta TaxID=157465 RepID=A0A7W8VCD0_9ACTN|nr:hypothetical protein [Nocardiopsis composta]MBB5430764.1 hypothetical protein [Nocardiopsis composta]
MRRLVPLAALLLAAACSSPAADGAGGTGPPPAPSPSAPARTWDGLPDAELTASTTVSAERYVPPPTGPEPEGADPDEYGDAPGDPFYRPPGMDPCEPNEFGYEDNDACLAQNGHPYPG